MDKLVAFFRMLDDFNSEMENTDSKLDTTMKKVAKVLHMSNGECNLNYSNDSCYNIELLTIYIRSYALRILE